MEHYKYLTPDEVIALFEMDEISLFLVIDRLMTIRKDIQLDERRLHHYRRILFMCIRQTTRFGVIDLPTSVRTGKMLTSPLFEAWFKFHKEWFESKEPKVRSLLIIGQREGKDISKYTPTGNWQEAFPKEKDK